MLSSKISAILRRPLCLACAAYTAAIALSVLSPLSAIIVALLFIAFAICAAVKKLPYFFVAIIIFMAFSGGLCHLHFVEKGNENVDKMCEIIINHIKEFHNLFHGW